MVLRRKVFEKEYKVICLSEKLDRILQGRALRACETQAARGVFHSRWKDEWL
jgi:hypothetical protein